MSLGVNSANFTDLGVLKMKKIFKVLAPVMLVLLVLSLFKVEASAIKKHEHCMCGVENCTLTTGGHSGEKTWESISKTSFVDYQTDYVTVKDNILSQDGVGYFYLTEDVTLSKPLYIKLNTDVNICLNGHVLNCPSIVLQYATSEFDLSVSYFTITDCNKETTHYFDFKKNDAWVLNDEALDKASAITVDQITDQTADDTLIAVPGGCLTLTNGMNVENVTSFYNVNIIGCGAGITSKRSEATNFSKCNVYGNKADTIIAQDTAAGFSRDIYMSDVNIRFNTGSGLDVNDTCILKNVDISNNGGHGINANPNHGEFQICGKIVVKDNKDYDFLSVIPAGLYDDASLSEGSYIGVDGEEYKKLCDFFPYPLMDGILEIEEDQTQFFHPSTENFAIRKIVGDEGTPTIAISQITEEASWDNKYTISVNTTGLTSPTVTYKWQKRYIAYTTVEFNNLSNYFYMAGAKAQADTQNSQFSSVLDEGIQCIDLEIDLDDPCAVQFTSTSDIELVDKSLGSITKSGMLYTCMVKGYGFKIKAKNGSAFTIGNVKIGQYDYNDVPNETAAKLGTAEFGEYYHCLVKINGFPETSQSFKVISDGSVEVSNTNTGSSVDQTGLKKIMSKYQNISIATKVKISLDVKKDTVPDADKTLIQNEVTGKTIKYYNVGLFLTEENDDPVNIGNVNNELIDISYDLNLSACNGVQVFRVHGGTVSELTTTPNAAGEKITLDTTNNKVIVTACKYSTYAIAYSQVGPTPPPTGDSNLTWLYIGIALALIAVLGALRVKKNF